MFQLRLSDAMASIRDVVCPPSYGWSDHSGLDPKGLRRNKGIVFNVSITLSDYSVHDDNQTYISLNILVFGNTSVFWKYANQSWDEAVNTSNHDSCWRSDGFNFLTDLYFKACEKVNKDKPPKDISQFTRFDFRPFELVEVTWDMDKTCPQNYKRIVKSVTVGAT